MTKHVPLRAPIHAQNCQCPRCRHIRISDYRSELMFAGVGAIAGLVAVLAIAVVKFWPAIAASLPL